MNMAIRHDLKYPMPNGMNILSMTLRKPFVSLPRLRLGQITQHIRFGLRLRPSGHLAIAKRRICWKRYMTFRPPLKELFLRGFRGKEKAF